MGLTLFFASYSFKTKLTNFVGIVINYNVFLFLIKSLMWKICYTKYLMLKLTDPDFQIFCNKIYFCRSQFIIIGFYKLSKLMPANSY